MNEKLYDLPVQDKAYLENKYHRTDAPFDGFNRMAYHGYDYDPATGMTDAEIVRFASACSAIAISRFPLPLNPPTCYSVYHTV